MKKIFLNCVILNKFFLVMVLLSQTFFLQAPPRVEILKRSASDETDRRRRISNLTIDVAAGRIEDHAHSARHDDSARTRRVWEVIKIITTDNQLKPFQYDEKRQFYTTSALSPSEFEEMGNILFPTSVDSYLNAHALAVHVAQGTHLYLPGVAIEPDDLSTFGFFHYRLRQQKTHHSVPELVCDYRKFDPIAQEKFHFDDTLLTGFDVNNPLTAAGMWDSNHVKKVFTDLAEIRSLLETEQRKLNFPQENSFQTCVLSNWLTLRIGQAKLALAKAPHDTKEIMRQLKSYQGQIGNSKDQIFGSTNSIDDPEARQERLDQVSIIDNNRKLQVATLLAAWDTLHKNNTPQLE